MVTDLFRRLALRMRLLGLLMNLSSLRWHRADMLWERELFAEMGDPRALLLQAAVVEAEAQIESLRVAIRATRYELRHGQHQT